MKRMKKWLAVIGLAGMIGLCGCGSSSKDMAAEAPAAMEESAEFESMGVTSDYDMPAEEAIEETAAEEGTSVDSPEVMEEKLVITQNLEVETEDFDGFWAKVNQKVSALGGYIEYSEVSGTAEYKNRYGNLTVRIPAKNLSNFVIAVDENGTVVYETKTTENITLQYVDTKSHINALRIEEETLLDLLEKAEKLDDVFAIQNRLTEVRYQLESYESQMRVMDNQVDYSTVHLGVNEVMRETEVQKKGFWSEAGIEFRSSIYRVVDGAKDLAIWFIGNLPVFVVYAIVIVIAVFFGKKIMIIRKKRIAKHLEAKEKKENIDDSIQ